jgi:uncharacterized protein
MEKGEADPLFKDEEQANRIISLIMRHYNSVMDTFNTDPASFEPIYRRDVCWGASEWCEGFLLGFQFNEQDWSLLAVGQPTWLTPFLRLGTDDGIAMTESTNDAVKWMNEIESSLMKIHEYWKYNRANQPFEQFRGVFDFHAQKEAVTIVRDGPKIGRNDQCPCGSGKKFKKCCGADGTSLSLH